jgi:hypothetical protein
MESQMSVDRIGEKSAAKYSQGLNVSSAWQLPHRQLSGASIALAQLSTTINPQASTTVVSLDRPIHLPSCIQPSGRHFASQRAATTPLRFFILCKGS